MAKHVEETVHKREYKTCDVCGDRMMQCSSHVCDICGCDVCSSCAKTQDGDEDPDGYPKYCPKCYCIGKLHGFIHDIRSEENSFHETLWWIKNRWKETVKETEDGTGHA